MHCAGDGSGLQDMRGQIGGCKCSTDCAVQVVMRMQQQAQAPSRGAAVLTSRKRCRAEEECDDVIPICSTSQLSGSVAAPPHCVLWHGWHGCSWHLHKAQYSTHASTTSSCTVTLHFNVFVTLTACGLCCCSLGRSMCTWWARRRAAYTSAARHIPVNICRHTR